MANHPSARKRARQNKKRRATNVRIKSAVKTAVKKARTAVGGAAGDLAAVAREAEAALARAASHGVIPRGRASRKIARIMKAANRAAKAAKA